MENTSTNITFFQTLIPALLTAVITILGFIITYNGTTRTFKQEVQKEKVSLFLGKVESLPMQIQELMNDILDKQGTESYLQRFKAIMAQLFAYGSKDAIKLTASMQELNYKIAETPDSVEKNKLIAYYILLICQIKYDLTGIEISPQYWYRLRLKDYASMRQSLDKANNEIVDELGLQSFLRIQVL